MAREKSPDLVLVEWVDAYHLDGWQFGEEAKVELDSCWTLGFCIDKNKDGVVIAQTWYPNDVANLICIPKGMIKKLTILGDLNFGVSKTEG